MRHEIASAKVGDDVFGDDPTVNELEEMAADLLGKEAALYVPSGTMANQIAIWLHTRRGDEAVMEAGAHPFLFEAGASAMISGVSINPIAGTRGILDPEKVRAAFRPIDPHFSPLKLICAEDTANRGGGTVYPLETLDALGQVAHDNGAAAHLDGARLFNAVVASKIPAARRARGFDTVSICLSKGLGAPVGSLLCGPKARMNEARRARKAMGGGMRQAGFLAAAGLYALRHHIDRLSDDHQKAEQLAKALSEIGLDVQQPETNMVYFGVPQAAEFVEKLKNVGILCTTVSSNRIRMVTHLDITAEGMQHTITQLQHIQN